jgi:hypothetical protein
MLNERAYAAAGGFSVRESRAEVGNLILRAVDIFGEDITAETLDATVTVSPRNLAWLMNAGKQAVYRDLITPAAQDYPTYRSFELQQDINASYFAEELSFYISVTLDAFYRQAYRSARKTGLTPAMASTQAVTQAYAEAIELVKAHRNVSVPPIFNTAYSQFFGFITRRTFSGRYPKDL